MEVKTLELKTAESLLDRPAAPDRDGGRDRAPKVFASHGLSLKGEVEQHAD